MLLALWAAAAACTSVKVAQKDNCWVRRSERWLAGSKEEVGPCAPPEPRWSEDRLTRLMQECVARADYRWQARALDAWTRGDRLPEQTSEEKVLQQCLGEPTRAVLAENDALRGRNDALQKRLAELSSDRDLARTSEEDARRRLVGGYEKMAEKMTDYLGTAANKAQAPATATANASSDSEGTAHTESAHDASTSLAAQTTPGQPGTVVVAPAPAAGPAEPVPAVRKARARPRPAARAEAPACPPAPAAAAAAPARSEAVWAPALVAPPPAGERATAAAP
ncbi:hypothetical protein AMYX_37250 [Anaeromyxobacter diazotrophicus]|uniref:Uncharacterized protein n=1 Tax=Anaeromyxobacter diazotrophicus TaxID=2590199 RepID=A0A7I9VRC7_9BACT|nr:hypothetical protein AMYX_37250 [Anaeromyxobacter diazotrophicus]